MDERLKMAGFAFTLALCTAGIWLMQASGPKTASAGMEPVSDDQRMQRLVEAEVARELPGLVQTEVKRQLDLAALKAQQKKSQDDELLRVEAEKWAPALSGASALQTVRSQLQLYRLQHHGHWPTLAALQDWSAMLSPTDGQGAALPREARTEDGPFGPYLQSAPINYFNQKTTVVAMGHAASDAGWSYDENTGAIHLVVPASQLERAKPLDGDFEIGR